MNSTATDILDKATRDKAVRAKILELITRSTIHMNALIYHLNLPQKNAGRAIRKHIELLIKEGAVIGGDDKGFFIIRTKEDLLRIKNKRRAIALAHFHIYKLLEDNYRKANPQEYIDEQTSLLTLDEFLR